MFPRVVLPPRPFQVTDGMPMEIDGEWGCEGMDWAWVVDGMEF